MSKRVCALLPSSSSFSPCSSSSSISSLDYPSSCSSSSSPSPSSYSSSSSSTSSSPSPPHSSPWTPSVSSQSPPSPPSSSLGTRSPPRKLVLLRLPDAVLSEIVSYLDQQSWHNGARICRFSAAIARLPTSSPVHISIRNHPTTFHGPHLRHLRPRSVTCTMSEDDVESGFETWKTIRSMWPAPAPLSYSYSLLYNDMPLPPSTSSSSTSSSTTSSSTSSSSTSSSTSSSLLSTTSSETQGGTTKTLPHRICLEFPIARVSERRRWRQLHGIVLANLPPDMDDLTIGSTNGSSSTVWTPHLQLLGVYKSLRRLALRGFRPAADLVPLITAHVTSLTQLTVPRGSFSIREWATLLLDLNHLQVFECSSILLGSRSILYRSMDIKRLPPPPDPQEHERDNGETIPVAPSGILSHSLRNLQCGVDDSYMWIAIQTWCPHLESLDIHLIACTYDDTEFLWMTNMIWTRLQRLTIRGGRHLWPAETSRFSAAILDAPVLQSLHLNFCHVPHLRFFSRLTSLTDLKIQNNEYIVYPSLLPGTLLRLALVQSTIPARWALATKQPLLRHLDISNDSQTSIFRNSEPDWDRLAETCPTVEHLVVSTDACPEWIRACRVFQHLRVLTLSSLSLTLSSITAMARLGDSLDEVRQAGKETRKSLEVRWAGGSVDLMKFNSHSAATCGMRLVTET